MQVWGGVLEAPATITCLVTGWWGGTHGERSGAIVEGSYGGLWAVATYSPMKYFGIFMACTSIVLRLVNLYNIEKAPPLGHSAWVVERGLGPLCRSFVMTISTGSGGGVCISALPCAWQAVFTIIPKGTYTEQSQGSPLYYITWVMIIILCYYRMVSCYNTGHGHMFYLNYLRKTLVQPPSPKLMI